VNYIQASELLPHCVMTICHGGLNTITQSNEAGVPLLVFPGPVLERRFNALRVQETNAGFFGELGDFTPDWISDKLEKIESRKINIVHLQKKLSFL
jgi:UDP:flavonoid glycosyltransferase YjiC (YdhE family)